MIRWRDVLVAGVAYATLAARPLVGQVAYVGSVQFASGDYIFSERTNSAFLLNGISASSGELGFSLSMPLILQSTPWITYGGVTAIPSGGTEHSELSRQMGRRRTDEAVTLVDTTAYREIGIGDPLAHADFKLWSEGTVLPSLRITADVKVPIANVDRGFGTGEWDYSAGVALAKSLGRTMLFTDVAYWVLGDLPDLELKDPIAYSVGLGHALPGGRVGLLATVFGYTRILEGVDPPAQVSLGLSYLLGGGRSLLGSAAFGLSESSPDISFSFGWRLPL